MKEDFVDSRCFFYRKHLTHMEMDTKDILLIKLRLKNLRKSLSSQTSEMKEDRNALIMNDRKHVRTQVKAPEKTPKKRMRVRMSARKNACVSFTLRLF